MTKKKMIDLKDKLILAPMAGVTDLPFRLLCKEQGCDVLYTEMVSAKAILYHNRNTRPLMEYRPEEHPIGLQLFGSSPEIMAEIAAQVQERGYDFIDVNMGCPVPKIVNNNE
ncbi:MAG: tRNA-dihydrouridine synthase family protein, partial [Lachnospiraceae bacterium]|nr:tRNA-dihydrouridine synthase family protein [Lachnospiraceae bacterium]